MKPVLFILASLSAFNAVAADTLYRGTEQVAPGTEREITIEVSETVRATEVKANPELIKDIHNVAPRTDKEAVKALQKGLVVQLTNSLPQTEINGKRVTPAIQGYFCSPALFPSAPNANRCVALDGEVLSGETAVFAVSLEQLDHVFKQGGGKGSFEFADKFQKTGKSWTCEQPNAEVTLDPNFDARQVWELNVTKRNSLSYTCGVTLTR